MQEIIYFIISYLIEVTKLGIVILGLFEYRAKRKLLVSIAGLIIIITATVAKHQMEWLESIDLTYFLGVIVICVFILSIEGKKRILHVVLSYFAICLIDMVPGGILLFLLHIDNQELYQNYYYMCVGNAMSIPFFLLMRLLFRKLNLNMMNILKKIKTRYLIWLLIAFIGYGMFIAPVQIYGISYEESKVKSFYAIGISLSGIAFLTVSITLIMIYDSKQHYKELYKLNERLIEQQKDYYLVLKEKNENIRKFRHDVSNHISCLTHLCNNANYDKMKQYLSQMQVTIDNLRIKTETGNEIVNAIVNDIMAKNNNNKLILQWNGIIPENIKITPMDLCIIFSNLLTNATEAVKKLEQGNIITIAVMIKRLNNNLVIYLENPVAEKVSITGNKLSTSKEDKEKHGIGSINIEECIKKYQGDLMYQCTSTIFTTEIIFQDIINE